MRRFANFILRTTSQICIINFLWGLQACQASECRQIPNRCKIARNPPLLWELRSKWRTPYVSVKHAECCSVKRSIAVAASVACRNFNQARKGAKHWHALLSMLLFPRWYCVWVWILDQASQYKVTKLWNPDYLEAFLWYSSCLGHTFQGAWDDSQNAKGILPNSSVGPRTLSDVISWSMWWAKSSGRSGQLWWIRRLVHRTEGCWRGGCWLCKSKIHQNRRWN